MIEHNTDVDAYIQQDARNRREASTLHVVDFRMRTEDVLRIDLNIRSAPRSGALTSGCLRFQTACDWASGELRSLFECAVVSNPPARS